MSSKHLLKRTAAPAVTVMVLALLAGCGGGSTTTTTTATSPTAGAASSTAELEKYRAELKPKNEAVESARRSFETVQFTGSNYSEIEAAFTTYTNALGTYLKSLEEAHAPVAVAGAAQSYVSHLRQHLRDVEQALKSARAQDGAAVSADLEKAHTSAKECTVASNFYAEACRW